VGGGRQWGEGWEGNTHKEKEGGREMFARIPGKGITFEMYIRNTQVNKKKQKNKKQKKSPVMHRQKGFLSLVSKDTSPK